MRRVAIVDPTARVWARLPRWGQGLVVLGALTQYWQSVLFFPVGLYVLLALGLNIVVGFAGLLDLGYVAFYAVGAYTTALLGTKAHWTTWEALPAGSPG